MGTFAKGGSFLLSQTNPEEVFTPEDFTEEHRMILKMVSGFVTDNVLSKMEDLEAQKEGLLRQLLLAAGELGLLGADIPEEYGGFELDKISSTVIAEGMGRAGSFAMTHGGQTGIGSLPIVLFGTPEQKRKYLPEMVSGLKIGAYALTEPGSGSDALAAKTKAILSPDGKSYILNGTKQFITNAGPADIFIIYAKVNGEQFSAFIVGRNAPGLSTGTEEKKMGIKGSSTRTLILEDVEVPVENLLFQAGRGHVVAFNILNLGRYKLAANALGGAKFALELAAGYANVRQQFGTPLAGFGLIQEKLAEMAIAIFAAESMVYRTGGLFDEMLRNLNVTGVQGGSGPIVAKASEEYAVECSLNKVMATEMLGYVVDEAVQIHGGYGFISEYPVERLYRDARIYRIFEGTNEINRILIPTTLIRRAKKGDLALQEGLERVERQLELASAVPPRNGAADLVQAVKDLFLFTLGSGIKILGDGLLKQQEILGRLADLAIGALAMESAWLRAEKARAREGQEGARLKRMLAEGYIYGRIGSLKLTAAEALAALTEGRDLEQRLAEINALCRYEPINTVALRRTVAESISAAGHYVVT
ncbi:Acyl-CoA dehydrogenase/oxidase C-terminal [Acididesulfobacillus acetoxydans]|uniref:Acyl-CoA dehydrogenase member 9, mitochondrial n=1 Tax=Acididesulfobacillus acetoxydans TaxID=1561005 RepID=A0A8S0WFK1_9FIRM|nr:acyl-CoA dehydrogenase family protein [Acididesulfobacillus acetoxydans]CAA7601122.1 Acyl-CoA dehydrogenase/oxidase C-terminal [Acididesulfobacillus acetoxydans]CEJ08599.1 Acyl-CoA dehydrogenase member 9, mitochondrial [Acididesulfobacillus acetoxydans]